MSSDSGERVKVWLQRNTITGGIYCVDDANASDADREVCQPYYLVPCGSNSGEKKKKRCCHKRIRAIVVNCGGGIHYCFGHFCEQCEAVKDSINCHSKWKRGDPAVLIDELATKYGAGKWEYL